MGLKVFQLNHVSSVIGFILAPHLLGYSLRGYEDTLHQVCVDCSFTLKSVVLVSTVWQGIAAGGRGQLAYLILSPSCNRPAHPGSDPN